MAVGSAFLVVCSDLRSGDHVGLCFYGTRFEESFPVSETGANGKCGRIGYDLGIETFEGQRYFGES